MGFTKPLALILSLSCLAFPASATEAPTLYLQIAPRLKPFQDRLVQHLSHWGKVQVLPTDATCRTLTLCNKTGQKVITLGGTGLSPTPSMDLASEDYTLKSQETTFGTLYASHGSGDTGKEGLRSELYGAYALLKHLGARFAHPFQPRFSTVAQWTPLPEKTHTPHWKSRGFVHHTMHPLEMTHVLNGWGPKGPKDEAGWQALLKDWDAYLEWLVAQGQNKVEWVLLEDVTHPDFSRSRERQLRLQTLVKMGHRWGIKVGVDAPIALAQQNAWRLLTKDGTPAERKETIRVNLDWIVETGIDFFSTEMGFSEFTKPTDHDMLDWLNFVGDYLKQEFNLPFYTKVHISSQQEAEHFKDPDTGKPLNFNYLPYYAHKTVGIMPHTVQMYSFDDPAFTYGQKNFKDMYRYLRLEMGKRPILWFPESAYWINYDINVPLFLPIYIDRRLHDVRMINAAEKEKNTRIEGQIMFSSGFEWGYWLTDLMTAQYAWNGGEQDLKSRLSQWLQPFGQTAQPFTQLLQDTIASQYKWLIAPGKINGMAYLAGQDTWSEMGILLRQWGLLKGFQTQPDKIHFQEILESPTQAKVVQKQVLPMLTHMERDFAALARRCKPLTPQTEKPMQALAHEICDGLEINALRARQVRALYESTLNSAYGQKQAAQAWLAEGQSALDQAHKVVTRRENQYSGRHELIASAPQQNPTVYDYGYLWPTHSLYFWERDQAKLRTGNFHPCYRNIIDPLEVALSDPNTDIRAQLARGISPLLGGFKDCLHPQVPPKN